MEPSLKYLQPDVVSKLSNMELRARMVVEGFITGMHKSPYHGFSVEFAEHRQYMPGDEIRSIDWKVFGKTDRYYIKEYEEETNLKSYAILDASASMSFASPGSPGEPGPRITKLQYASYLVAALSYLMVQQRDAVGLSVFDAGIRFTIPPHATKAHLRRILVELEHLSGGGTTGTAKALHALAERISRRGLIIVLSDLLDDPDAVMTALRHFRYHHHDVLVMQILDPLERSFAFGGDALFRDLETREELATQPYHIQREYQKEMRAFLERYKRECRENHIDYVLLDTGTPFDAALFQYLNKRERMA
ncbi:MAG TPA: DUF58 domain-containing protein [Bacteroidota bacterium]|nr:DUF58 domain-containing protein [Bacteroidota bacterium]